MKSQHLQLRQIVALKRQRAEQSLAMLTAELHAREEDLEVLQRSLNSANDLDQEFLQVSLAARNGHVRRLLWQIREKRQQIQSCQQELLAAKDELKKILVSEEALSKQSFD